MKLGDQIEILSDMGEKITFTIAGTVDFGNEYNGNLFFLPTDLIKVLRSKVTNFNTQLSIRTDLQELPLAEQFVFDTLSGKQDLVIESYTDVLAFAQKSLKAYTAPIYGLVIFIGLFGIINLINTLMTNLISRQQEFGAVSYTHLDVYKRQVKEKQPDGSVRIYVDEDLKQKIALKLLEEIPNFPLEETERVAKEETEGL